LPKMLLTTRKGEKLPKIFRKREGDIGHADKD
jgi:hypothetical protein